MHNFRVLYRLDTAPSDEQSDHSEERETERERER